jgi:alpha-glucosidase
MTSTEWWRDAVIYQIYPRSFADSDGDGIGDLPGILGRLDYLNDGTPASLGVDAIWLSPFYPSPQADFGYDVSDHMAVDPRYGTLEDFDKLLSEAHARGVRIIVDLVMNHTSHEHAWFVESRSSRKSFKRDWYIWAEAGEDGGPPNNWLSAFEASGSAWTWDETSKQYYLHSFTPEQPDLNWRTPGVRAAMEEVWRFWLDRGVDGFRVDVAHRFLKDPQLRDNPPELADARRHVSHPWLRQRQLDQPEVHDALRELREVLDSYGDRFALGEVPISDDKRLVPYIGQDELQTAFHISFWEQPWDGSAFQETVDGLAELLGPEGLPTYALATHDISRTVTRYGGRRRARVAAMMLLTLRGVVCIYYGEEVGMADADPPPDQAQDVDGRDGTRIPMQWDETGSAFTTGEPWLPFGSDLADVNVMAQHDDPGSLLNLYRRLVWYRRGSDALRRGAYHSVQSSDDSFLFRRWTDDEQLLVALNFSAEPSEVDVPGLPAKGVVELSTGAQRTSAEVDLHPLLLAPDEGLIIRLDSLGPNLPVAW